MQYEINNINELANLLKKKGENHNFYHHYTTSKSLNLILKNRTLRLTRGNSKTLNDWHEYEAKGLELVWNRTYIACFSFGDFENMAMWGLYGLPSNEAVRLTLTKKAFNFIRNYNSDGSEIKIYKNPSKKEFFNKESIESITLSDVFYVKDKGKQRYKGYEIIFNDTMDSMFHSEKATGIVKNYSWGYEKEVRIIIRLKDKQYEEKIENGEAEKTILENIYLELPEEVFKSCKITHGPNFKGGNRNNDELVDTLSGKLSLESSSYKGLIHFKSDKMVFPDEDTLNKL